MFVATCYPQCNNQAFPDIEIAVFMDIYKASDNTEYWVHKWNYTALCNETNYIPHGLNDTNSIDLSSNNISGTLPNSIGNLMSLQELHLQNNRFRGI